MYIVHSEVSNGNQDMKDFSMCFAFDSYKYYQLEWISITQCCISDHFNRLRCFITNVCSWFLVPILHFGFKKIIDSVISAMKMLTIEQLTKRKTCLTNLCTFEYLYCTLMLNYQTLYTDKKVL